MKLNDYLKAEGMKSGHFAMLLGVHASSLSRWMHGKRQPRIAACLQIQRLTNGAVEPKDFLAALDEPPND